MGLIKDNYVVDIEKGIVYNKYGHIEYYIEFNENETYIEYRNTDGRIIDYYKSGERLTNREEGYKSMLEKYRDWKYYEEEFNR